MIHLPPRAYIDTSVYGGYFDPEFEQASAALSHLARGSKIELVASALVEYEIQRAPKQVRDLYLSLQADMLSVPVGEDSLGLLQHYLAAKVVPRSQSNDALHVAIASLNGCSLIVSWNFKDLVNFRRIAQFNAVNLALGLPAVTIHSPSEVVL